MKTAETKFEVRYRGFGRPWRRKRVTSQGYDRLLAQLMDRYGNAFEFQTVQRFDPA